MQTTTGAAFATTEDIDTTASLRLYERALEVAPGGIQGAARHWRPYPIYFRRGEGGHIWDVDDHEFVDLWAAAGPILLGHNDPRVMKPVIASIAERGVLLCLPHEREVLLAERLRAFVPSAEYVTYGCGGSDVCHFALRAARAFTGRPKYVKCEGAYHGWTDPLLASIKPAAAAYGPADDPATVPASSGLPTSVSEDCLIVPFNDLDALERRVRAHRGAIAAVFVEPILHTPGCVMPAPGYLEGVREICSREGIVLVFDEIITGFRHHVGGYQAICGVVPDLSLLGKAMSNGFPVAALAGREDVMKTFAPVGDAYYSGTFMGQSLLIEAALSTLDVLEGGEVHEHVFALGDRLAERVTASIRKHGVEACFEHFGSVWSLYFGTEAIANYRDVERTGYPQDRATQALRAHLRMRGYYFHPATTRAYLMDAHTATEIERLADAIDEFLEEHRTVLSP
jgi:glutamate-1-semialdehyde 2,1-aminomutase